MDWKSHFHTAEDFERAEEEMRTKKQWGRWTLDTEGAYHSLDIRPYANDGLNGGPYEVRLFEQGGDFPAFTAWLGHWVQHLQEKSWLTPQDLWDFVDAAQDIHRRETK
jgi:hypothetical protein